MRKGHQNLISDDLLALCRRFRDERPTSSFLGWKFIGDSKTAMAAEVDRRVRALSALQIAELERWLGQLSNWSAYAWTPKVAMTVADGRPGVLALFAMEQSGYVREAAVRALAEETDGFKLAPLLLRLNDWVPVVREAAAEGVRACVSPAYAGDWLEAAPLLEGLGRQRRANHAWVLEAFEAVMRAPEAEPLLTGALRSGDVARRRLVFRVLASRGASRNTILEGSESPDPVLRRQAVRRALEILGEHEALPVLRGALKDKSTPVRREALISLAENYRGQAGDPLMAALWDARRGIRSIAQFHLGRTGGVDVPRQYLDRLGGASPAVVRVAVLGVGEVGSAGNASDIRGFLRSDDARIRQAALLSIGKLDLESNVAVIAEHLAGEVAGASRIARDLLLRRPGLIALLDPAELMSRAESDASRHHVLSLIASLPWWRAAAPLVRACGNPSLRVAALQHLARFQGTAGRHTATPSAGELDDLRGAFRDHRGALDRRTEADLREQLAPYAP